jgi:uncharacterized protein YprB with RNaseH-like and TPR domain
MAMGSSQGPLEQKLRALRRPLQRGDIVRASELLGRMTGRAAPARQGAAPHARAPLPLAEACAGVEISAPGGGRFWLVRRELAEAQPDMAPLSRRYAAIIGGARQRFDELAASAALCRAADGRPEDLLFLGIEACSLAPKPVFLVGLMHFEGGRFVLDQCLARNFSEEPAILSAFAERLAAAPVLVTFNGKKFGMNLVRRRCAMHGLAVAGRLAFHLDLLRESRRRWRGSVPNCRLRTLERRLCGRERVGDIPGSMIGEAYRSFVRSGDARPIAAILRHNALDLATMGELACHLLCGSAPE